MKTCTAMPFFRNLLQLKTISVLYDVYTNDSPHVFRQWFYSFKEPLELRCEKTGLRGFRPGPRQTGLYNHRRWLEARNFGFRKKRDCTICVAKTKALISCAVFAPLLSHMQKSGFLMTRLIKLLHVR